MDFEIVIIGSDINAYYMARNAHEKYNKKVTMIAKESMNFTSFSNIVNIEFVDNLWDQKVFVNKMIEVGKRFNNKKALLIASNDFYVRLIVENEDILKKYFLFNYPTLDTVNNLLIKDNFYEKYEKILDMPKTYIYDCNTELDEKKIQTFMFPIIIKPGDGIEYYEHHFNGQAKVFKLNSLDEVKSTIKKIEKSGYNKKLIIQEFIPGDDTHLFDSILYVSKKGDVWVQSFAQIGLQEHTSTGVGNLTVLINGYNEFVNNDIINKLKDFLLSIKYTGIAEFDLKYDERDKKFKVFEINPRQARSSYYLTALGYNLVECLVDDLIYNKQKKYKLLNEKVCLTFVPKYVIMKYIKNQQYKKEVLKLYKQKKVVNPLNYKKDKNLKRKIWLFIRNINYIKKYKRNEW